MHQRRWVWALAAIAVIGIGLGALVWTAGDDQDDEAAATTTSTDGSTTTRATSSTSGTASTTTTAGESGAAPPRVDAVSAGPGGGSGEVVLNWDAVAGATGYRVLRASSPNGTFETVADLNITTGSATAAADVVNVWSEHHSYIPSAGALDAPDRSPRFEYIDLVTSAGQRCYRVVPYNAAGDGRGSVTACGSPP